ncbi:NINE protein [Corynebacterium macginleyi]|uniref:TM2 domain-containing protein n=1 Tax=Corynebacterium macginleyi TaxID=38290 RepID=UPI00190DCB32|nr:TM2 domain-containing protein [Corynebacterium macginleyi]MBK4146844.1 NINE protein [Corynebacterium macginleyi]
MTSPYNSEHPEGNLGSSQFPGQSQQNYSKGLQSGAYPQEGYPQQQYVAAGNQKSWVATLLLCFFMGGLGAHNFYTGRTLFAIVQLSLNVLGWLTFWFFLGFLFWGILAIWLSVEFFMILLGGGRYDRDARGVPLQK